MKFGTSGLRGLVVDMNDALCARYAAAFVAHLRAEGPAPRAVLIGRDLRPSSPRIASAVAAGLRAAGAVPVDCGVAPTPALALEAAARGVPAVMVTGSHIPFDRNGVKFYRAEGEILKRDELGILASLERIGPLCLDPAPPATERCDAVARYRARYSGFFPGDLLEGRRIGLYEHSAAGRDVAALILADLGAEVIRLGRTDAFVPIDTEAIRPEDAELARRWSTEHRLDALLSTDGDGDRPLMADETGAFLRGDVAGVLTARYLRASAVATPISSNSVVERCGWFAEIARTRIGSPYVIAAMEAFSGRADGVVVGYEANGGFLLGSRVETPDGRALAPLPTRDAILPMLSVLALAAQHDEPVSRTVARLPRRFTASDRLTDAPPSMTGPLLEALAGPGSASGSARARLLERVSAQCAAVDLTDGVRMALDTDEIVHLRASGNAPELRCYAEAATPERAGQIVAMTLGAVAAVAL